MATTETSSDTTNTRDCEVIASRNPRSDQRSSSVQRDQDALDVGVRRGRAKARS